MADLARIRAIGVQVQLGPAPRARFAASRSARPVAQKLLLDQLLKSPCAVMALRRHAIEIGLPAWVVDADHDRLAAQLRRQVRAGSSIAIADGATDASDDGDSNAYIPAMQPQHIAAFSDAARQFNVFILVRETNLASLDHIGKGYAVAKRLDCKVKTADGNWVHSSGPKASAGLVVDPTIVPANAFRPGKHARSLALWNSFARQMIRSQVSTLEGQRGVTYIPEGGLYFVDLDPASPRYGCLKFTSSSLLTAGKYVHGDFDLYAIVPAGDPSRNIRVKEERLGEDHARSPEFFDVQNFVNSRIGLPMVLHGAQESYDDEHADEILAMFWPDGRITAVNGAQEIEHLYHTLFKNRKLFTSGGAQEVVRGGFMTSA